MKGLILHFFLLLSFYLPAQIPPLQWLTAAGGTGIDQSASVCYDQTGNVYSTGYFRGTIDFDPSPSVYTLSSNGGADVFIMKSDPSGNFVWAKSIGGPNDDEGASIDITSSGDLLITGDFESAMDADPSAGIFTLPFNGQKDVFILKLSSAGNLIWAKSFGSSDEENAIILTQDQSSSIYIGGFYSDTTDFDPGAGTFTLTANQTLRDSYALKLDSSGNFIWAKTFGGSTADDGVMGLSVDPNGNLLISAIFMHTVDLDPGPATFTVASTGSAWSTAIVKLDVNGNFVWGKKTGGSSNTYGAQITTDALGNVFTVGNFEGTTDFDPGTSVFNLTSAGFRDIWVSKLDASGNFVWAKIMGGTQFMDIGFSITADAAGDIFLTGSFDGVADMDPNAGTYTLSSAGGSGDIFLMKLSAAGNLVWAEGFGSSGQDIGRSVKVDASGNIYLAGFYAGVTDFYPGAITYTVNTQGSQDIFVQKLGACTASPPTPLSTTSGSLLSFCTGKSATLTANGLGHINWYTTPSGGSALTTSNTLITNTLSPGTHTFYIEATSTCGSSLNRLPVTVTVHPQPTVSVSSATICKGQGAELSVTGAQSYTFQTGNPVFYPSVTGVYTVVGTSSAGCISAPASATVTVLQPPTVSVAGGSICSGSSFTITPSGAATYSITGGTFIVSPTVTSNYTVTGYSQEGCPSIILGYPTVTVYNIPSISVNSGSLCAGQSFTLLPSGASSYSYFPSGPVVSPNTTGSYSITGISSQGCASTAQAVSTLTVHSLPVVAASSGTICAGNSFSMSVSGAQSYSYLPSGPLVSPLATTAYTITGSDSLGCQSLPVVSTVSVFLLPHVQLSASDTVVCAGEQFTLTASGAASYSWNTGATTSTLSGAGSSFTYVITGYDTSGCSSTSSLAVLVSICTALDHQNESGITMFPNPASDLIHFISSGNISACKVSVINTAGVVLRESENLFPFSLEIGDLEKGFYQVRIVYDSKVFAYKLIKI